jgi:hypothetical protein
VSSSERESGRSGRGSRLRIRKAAAAGRGCGVLRRTCGWMERDGCVGWGRASRGMDDLDGDDADDLSTGRHEFGVQRRSRRRDLASTEERVEACLLRFQVRFRFRGVIIHVVGGYGREVAVG